MGANRLHARRQKETPVPIPQFHDPDDYDTLRGLEAHVLTLEGLHGVVEARARAVRDKRPLKHAFLLFGRLMLHTDGNALGLERRRGGLATAADFGTDGIPTVATFADLQCDPKEDPFAPTWERHAPIEFAPVDVACAGCNRPWTIVDAFDYASASTGRCLTLHAYAGKTLREVIADLQPGPHGEASLDPYSPVRRHDRSIWLKPPEEAQAFRVQAEDWIHVIFVTHEHVACRRQRLEREIRALLETVVRNAGLDPDKLAWRPIPHPNGFDRFQGPWFVAEGPTGALAFGNMGGGHRLGARWYPCHADPADPPIRTTVHRKETTFFPYPYQLSDYLRAQHEEARKALPPPPA